MPVKCQLSNCLAVRFSAEECGACVISCKEQQYTHYQAALIAAAH